MTRFCLLIALIASTVCDAAGQTPSPDARRLRDGLTVVGTDGRTTQLTRADLEGLPQLEVRVVDPGGADATYRGPALRELATRAGAPTGRALRGTAMVLAVVVTSADGYRVAYSLAELDEQFGRTVAIVATTRNGTDLPEGDGPLRVVLPNDEFHARWARQVRRIDVVAVAAP